MVSLSKHLSPETMFCVSSNYTSCRRQLDQPQAGQSVSLLSIHHPPEIIFCVFYKYTSCCRQLNQPQAGWCLYCPYTIFQKLCSVSFLNTPSARLGYQGSVGVFTVHTPSSRNYIFFFFFFYKYTSCCRQLNQPQAGWCLYCPYTIFQKLCSVSFLNTPSARLGYQGSAVHVFSVYLNHTEESPIGIGFLAY